MAESAADGTNTFTTLVVALADKETDINAEAIKYLNRLSDLLFVLARAANANGEKDVLWTPGRFAGNGKKPD